MSHIEKILIELYNRKSNFRDWIKNNPEQIIELIEAQIEINKTLDKIESNVKIIPCGNFFIKDGE